MEFGFISRGILLLSIFCFWISHVVGFGNIAVIFSNYQPNYSWREAQNSSCPVPFGLYIYLFIHSFIFSFIHLLILFIYLFIYLSNCSSIYLIFNSFIYLSVYLLIYSFMQRCFKAALRLKQISYMMSLVRNNAIF